MEAKYKIGQRVLIKPIKGQPSEPASAVEQYTGQTGKVTDFYWINSPGSGVVYIYTVRVEEDKKVIVLYEDELGSTV